MEKYEGKNFIVYCGDALGILPTLAPPVDAIICDLPYGTTACKWDVVIPLEPLWDEYKRLIKPHRAVVLFGSQPFSSVLVGSNIKQFKYSLVWEKSHATGHLDCKRRPLRKHEDILVFGEGAIQYNPQISTKNKNNIRPHSNGNGTSVYGAFNKVKGLIDRSIPLNSAYPDSILRFDSVNPLQRLHDTQKPVDLLAYLVKTYTNEGEVVLDNCMGSGSCGVACLRTGRKFIGIERDPQYYEIALNRLRDEELKQESSLFAFTESQACSIEQASLFEIPCLPLSPLLNDRSDTR